MELPKSRGTWGRQKERTSEQMNEICGAFFGALKLPRQWKSQGWNRTEEPPPIGITSIGHLFRDMRTSGMELKEYRICFLSFSERGSIVEKSIKDFGKPDYKCIVKNLTVDKLNDFILKNYFNLDRVRYWKRKSPIRRIRMNHGYSTNTQICRTD